MTSIVNFIFYYFSILQQEISQASYLISLIDDVLFYCIQIIFIFLDMSRFSSHHMLHHLLLAFTDAFLTRPKWKWQQQMHTGNIATFFTHFSSLQRQIITIKLLLLVLLNCSYSMLLSSMMSFACCCIYAVEVGYYDFDKWVLLNASLVEFSFFCRVCLLQIYECRMEKEVEWS